MAIKITEALLAEHVVFHNLFDTVERVLPDLKTLREVHALATVLSAVLKAHSKVEDELIIEPLDHCFEQLGQHDTFHQEHEEIDASLGKCLNCASLRTARDLLRRAVVGSRQHFDKEERLIFPMAEKLLKAKTLAALGDRWREERKAIVG
jgi:hemerythrin-like domain-containing protein